MTWPARSADGIGLLVGYAADRVIGDPQRWHPVAGFGQLAAAAERWAYRDDRTAGAAYAAGLIGAAGGLGWLVQTSVRSRPLLRVVAVAASTWTVLGGRSLAAECGRVATYLERDDLLAARRQVSRLVGRDPHSLGAAEIARAAVESMAENTSDAVVAPLLWGAAAGVPGLLGYRAVNTLDAMIGHRSPRYLRFGSFAARVDDVANLIPARLAAGLAAAAAPVVGGSPRTALGAVRRDAHKHPSPNGGQVEAAFAGALGVTLGGQNTYAGRTEDRGTLGDGGPPTAADIRRATRLASVVSAMSALLCAGARVLLDSRCARRVPARRFSGAILPNLSACRR